MASTSDETEFVDTDFLIRKSSPATAQAAAPLSSVATHPTASLNRMPTREELEAQVSVAQQRLAELRRAQEELERERGALEEARRRRVEFQTGREEMLHGLTRGLGLLEESEFGARQQAEQMAKSIAGLRDALGKMQTIREDTWSQETWNTELTRALTTIDNARMEWNSARLKWPVLDTAPAAKEAAAGSEPEKKNRSPLEERSFLALCKLGLALTWPLLTLGIVILVVLLLR